MNIRQLDFRSIFSARSVPSIFWIIVAISSCLALLLILFLVVQGYRDGIQRSAAQKRQQVRNPSATRIRPAGRRPASGGAGCIRNHPRT